MLTIEIHNISIGASFSRSTYTYIIQLSFNLTITINLRLNYISSFLIFTYITADINERITPAISIILFEPV
jgi:hypothetical protein